MAGRLPQANEQGEPVCATPLSACAAMDAAQARGGVRRARRSMARAGLGCGRAWGVRRLARAGAPGLGGRASAAAAHRARRPELAAELPAVRVAGGPGGDCWRWAAVQAKADLDAVGAALRAMYLPWLEEAAAQAARGREGDRWLAAAAGGIETQQLMRAPARCSWTACATTSPSACSQAGPGLGTDVRPAGPACRRSRRPARLGARPWRASPARRRTWSSSPCSCGRQAAVWPQLPQAAADTACSRWTSTRPVTRKAAPGPKRATWTTTATSMAFVWRVTWMPSWTRWSNGCRSCAMRAGGACASSPTTAGCWMPGGLPKSELAKHQTETRWGRCAVLKDRHTAPR
jgi:hypothetical protein